MFWNLEDANGSEGYFPRGYSSMHMRTAQGANTSLPQSCDRTSVAMSGRDRVCPAFPLVELPV